jgi:hypothetical protein
LQSYHNFNRMALSNAIHDRSHGAVGACLQCQALVMRGRAAYGALVGIDCTWWLKPLKKLLRLLPIRETAPRQNNVTRARSKAYSGNDWPASATNGLRNKSCLLIILLAPFYGGFSLVHSQGIPDSTRFTDYPASKRQAGYSIPPGVSKIPIGCLSTALTKP